MTVDAEEVAQTISMMSGIPVTRIATEESIRIKGMRQESLE